MFRRCVAVFFVISLLTFSANALDRTDYTRMDNLTMKFLQLEQDILNVQPGTQGQAWDCLDRLSHNLETISLRIEFLTTLIWLAPSMKDTSDHQTVLDQLIRDGKNFLGYVEHGRKGISLEAGICSRHNVVAVQSQEILRFYDEASSLVRSMLSRDLRPFSQR
jgi:hypothetical protein